ncbi:MAG: endonuclease/exonuclease/phosphatase family protein [Bacteroidota bacterium]
MIYKVLFLINGVLALGLLLSGLDQWVNLVWFPGIHFLNLIVPLLVWANLVFFLFWAVFKRRNALLSLVVLCFAFFVVAPFFKLGSSEDVAKTGDFSILTLNAHEFDGPRWTGQRAYKGSIIEFVADQDADIICFQEFQYLGKNELSQYPYSYINHGSQEGEWYLWQAIYSKFPIINKGSLDFSDSYNNVIFADVVIQRDTVRIYNMHLQSLHFRLGNLKREEPQRLYQRLDRSIEVQDKQSRLIRKHMAGSTHKTIIAGDMNNTQFSHIYRKLKGEHRDTFQEKGEGLGSTYHMRFLPFRIDYIMADSRFRVVSHTNYDVILSDHKPIMASLGFAQDK